VILGEGSLENVSGGGSELMNGGMETRLSGLFFRVLLLLCSVSGLDLLFFTSVDDPDLDAISIAVIRGPGIKSIGVSDDDIHIGKSAKEREISFGRSCGPTWMAVNRPVRVYVIP